MERRSLDGWTTGTPGQRRRLLSVVLGPLRSAGAVERIATTGVGLSWADWGDLHAELDRSRRYGRPFTIVRVAPSRPRQTATPVELAAEVRRHVRHVDRVWADRRALYLLLPEGDGSMAEQLLDRVRGLLATGAGSFESSVATFPVDGLTSGALLSALEGGGARSEPLVEIVPAAGEGQRGSAAAR